MREQGRKGGAHAVSLLGGEDLALSGVGHLLGRGSVQQDLFAAVGPGAGVEQQGGVLGGFDPPDWLPLPHPVAS